MALSVGAYYIPTNINKIINATIYFSVPNQKYKIVNANDLSGLICI
jgi:hypothetical protein